MDSTIPPQTDNATSCGSRVEAHWRTVLIVVFALAMLFRLVYALQIRHSPIPELWRGQQTDMSFFVAWAKMIADGDWLTDQALHPYFRWQQPIGSLAEWNTWYGDKTFHQAPLYPYLLAVLFGLTGPTLWSIYVLQAVGSGLTAVVLASIGRRLFNPIVGMLSGAIAALYGPLIFYDFVALRGSLTVLASTLIVWSLIRAESSQRMRNWLLTGVLIGLAYLLRANAAIMFVLAMLGACIVFWRQWQRLCAAWAGMAAGMVVCLVPLVARNVAVGAKPLSTSAVGASALYLANGFGAPGVGWGRTRDYPEIMRRSGGRPMALLRETIASHHSVAGPMTLLATKASALVHYFEWTNNANPYYAERFSSVLRWATIPFWLILPLALMGLILTWSRRRRLIWLYVALLVPALTVLAFYQTARLRLPIVVGLIPLAAATVDWLIARRGNVVIVLMVTIPMCVAVRWPGDKDPPRVQERDFAAGADVLGRAGRHEAAIAEAREAVKRFPDSPASRFMLIEALRAAARYDQAADVCDRAVQDFPDEAALRICRADIHLDQNRPDLAVPLYRSVLRTKPPSAAALMGLSRALRLLGHSQDPDMTSHLDEQAVRLASQAVRLAPNDPETYDVLARALLSAGQNTRAAQVLKTGLERTARTDPHHTILERLRDDLKGS